MFDARKVEPAQTDYRDRKHQAQVQYIHSDQKEKQPDMATQTGNVYDILMSYCNYESQGRLDDMM